MKPVARFLLVALLLLLGTPVTAHVRSETHSVWEINGTHVDVVITIPLVEAARLGSHGEQPSDAALRGYLADRVFPLAGEQRCLLIPPIETLAAANGYRKYDFTFRCPSADYLKLHFSAFFDLIQSHLDFAQVQNVATGEFSEQLVTRDRQTIHITGGNELKTAGFGEFVRMGIMHIFTGLDHMSFLLGLVLISRRLRDLLFVVTGFTLGHSVTLALAVTGVIRPHADYIDALVALTIALIGIENMAVATRRPKPLAIATGGVLALMAVIRLFGIGDLPSLLLLGAGLFTANYLMISGRVADAGRLRMIITLIFGLIHGFGFAAGLLEIQIPTGRLAELLLGFNLGVEIGQLTLVLGVSGLVLLLSRIHLAMPRKLVVDLSACLLIGLGTYWFVTRSYA